MAMSIGAGAGGGGRGRRRRRRHGAMSEINMTPFIDVMLVLLIIFMVAAPLLTVGVPLDLPETAAKPINVEQKPLMLSIDDKGRVFLMETPLEDGEIVPKLMAVAKAGAEERIYIRGARQVDYGRVAQVMALVTAAGFKRVALVTEPEQHS
ncbi:biopolymer transporter ExbD [Chelatococcus daeguensis]|uniref:Protein TolR n=2 Tax=Chelatococcus TaxID=28209 RepID=A0AAC9JQC0_9HYPH|nr:MULTISPECIES: biopolymer transporter ExbD [Chelatococcus]APF38238.1 protein TolR [Chelatococcus daeguensis]KZE27506.1 protein TolR [Chelatococcus daeguensis]MBM3085734.1 biopolymer transporter ExbD [Chelatococcus daeguensis]CUA84528.1 Cell division and transport-associated protein TolR (TC 2.C.1.2.1) [Chelatococcus sambhunathii]